MKKDHYLNLAVNISKDIMPSVKFKQTKGEFAPPGEKLSFPCVVLTPVYDKSINPLLTEHLRFSLRVWAHEEGMCSYIIWDNKPPEIMLFLDWKVQDRLNKYITKQ